MQLCVLPPTPLRTKSFRGKGVSFAVSRLRFLIPQPRADVVGCIVTLLRSYLRLLSQADFHPLFK